MPTYHAYELVTETSFEIEVDLEESALLSKLERRLVFLQDNEIDLDGPTLIGTVITSDVQTAIDKIRAGNWEYSTKMSHLDKLQKPNWVVMVSVGKFEFELKLSKNSGSISSNALSLVANDDRTKAMIEGIESMLLGHAIAGIDVESEEYIEGLQSAIDSIKDS